MSGYAGSRTVKSSMSSMRAGFAFALSLSIMALLAVVVIDSSVSFFPYKIQAQLMKESSNNFYVSYSRPHQSNLYNNLKVYFHQ